VILKADVESGLAFLLMRMLYFSVRSSFHWNGVIGFSLQANMYFRLHLLAFSVGLSPVEN